MRSFLILAAASISSLAGVMAQTPLPQQASCPPSDLFAFDNQIGAPLCESQVQTSELGTQEIACNYSDGPTTDGCADAGSFAEGTAQYVCFYDLTTGINTGSSPQEDGLCPPTAPLARRTRSRRANAISRRVAAQPEPVEKKRAAKSLTKRGQSQRRALVI